MKQAVRRSQLALDGIAFFLSDVETGVGPFMAGYFAGQRHWNPEQIGIIIAAQKISSVAVQAGCGWIIDNTAHKKWLMAGSALAISAGAVFVAWSPGVLSQILNQLLVGGSTAIATLTLAALSLGLVGREALAQRIGRNGALSHAGNMLTASLAGYLGSRIGQQWIFYVSAALGLLCFASAAAVRSGDVNDQIAREAPGPGETITAWSNLFRNRNVLVFASVVILFHIANSALLPLAGEEISHDRPAAVAFYLTLCIVFPQLVMIPVSLLSGRGANKWGRKPLWIIAFTVLSLRGLIFAQSANPNVIVAAEALDGIGTGIAGVVTVLVVSDLAKGTGRFNALGGVMQSGLGIGAFLGNLLAGIAAKRVGFEPVFYALALTAGCGLFVLLWLMPETREIDSAAQQSPVGSSS